MPPSSTRPTLSFGVELELLIRPNERMTAKLASDIESKWNPAVNRLALRNKIAEILTGDYDITTRVDEHEQEVGDTGKWSIVDEGSLDEVPGTATGRHYWRVEIVSRTLKTDDETWQSEFDAVFEMVDNHFDVFLTKGCGMHVHVSPGIDTPYKAHQLIRILKAVAYFDDAVPRIMPAERKLNPWAMPNMRHEKVPKRVPDVVKAYNTVETATWEPLFRIYEKRVVTWPQNVYSTAGQDRSMAWNFGNIDHDCGTVEFRQPPGVETAADAKHWAAFTLGFIQQALDNDFEDVKHTRAHPDVSKLQQWVFEGLASLQVPLTTPNPALMVENKKPPKVWSAAHLEDVKRKKAAKEKELSAYAQKVNSRPNSPVSPDKLSKK